MPQKFGVQRMVIKVLMLHVEKNIKTWSLDKAH